MVRRTTSRSAGGKKTTSNGQAKPGPIKSNPAKAVKSAPAKSGPKGEAETTISSYLIERLHGLGLQKVFGIPGDYVLAFYDDLYYSPIEVIGTTREDCAGFAADAYARIHGLGAVCVTYCVGGLSVVNAVAGAYAEKSPLIVISGSPGLGERGRNALLHHKVKDFSTQREVFEKITVATAVLDDPLTATREIDRVLEAVQRTKRPVYIEIPRDLVHVPLPVPTRSRIRPPESDPNELAAAVAETAEILAASKKPVLIAGVEAHRFGLQDVVLQLAEKNQIPICSTLMGKSVVSEAHPLYVGVYAGGMGRELPRAFVEESDCVLMLGTFISDINLGIFTANLDPAKCIVATSEDIRIGYHHYHEVVLGDYVRQLAEMKFGCSKRPVPADPAKDLKPFVPKPDTPMTIARLFEKVNTLLTEDMVVICDVGDSLFGGADLVMRRRTEFLSPAYYTSMGFAIPAALGAQSADPKSRPMVLVGDGAFQMTGMELSTIHSQGLNPIVLVLNNKGYSTERFIKDGPYNDIGNWNYHKIPEVIGGGWGFEVHNETDLVKALDAALANKDSFSLLNIHLDPYDKSECLDRLGRWLAERVGGTKGQAKSK